MKYIIFLLMLCTSLTLNAVAEPIDVDERLLEYEWLKRNFGDFEFRNSTGNNKSKNNNAKPKNEDDEFMEALIQGDIKELVNQIDYGYDVNKKYENGITPLVYAVYYGNYNVVKLLIKAGADVNVSANSLVINVMGVNSSEYAMAPILLATIRGDTKMVGLLLKSGADIDKKDSEDRTSLVWAVCIGNAPMANFLIKKGANLRYVIPNISISKVEYENIDSMSIACIRNDFPTVKIILKHTKFTRNQYTKYLFLTSDEDIKVILSKKLKRAKS